MTPTSMGHDLSNGDPADLPRCPMEWLVDRMNTIDAPARLKRWGYRQADGSGYFELSFNLQSPDQLEDLINYLARVKG